MKKRLFGVFISIFVVVMLALPMSAVYAKPVDNFVEVEGVFHPIGPPTLEIMSAGNSDNQVVGVVMPQMWENDISGTGIVEAQWVIHNFDDEENKWVNVLGVVTLTGEVAGVPGTVTIKFSSVSSRGGHWRIIGGTGELANVRGQGILYEIGDFLFAYEGVIHFSP